MTDLELDIIERRITQDMTAAKLAYLEQTAALQAELLQLQRLKILRLQTGLPLSIQDHLSN